MPLSCYPFIDGPKELPEAKKKDVLKIKQWMQTQPHLPEITDDFVYLFLHACYFAHDKTKHAIEMYFTLRGNTLNLFGDRDTDSERMRTVASLVNLCRLPGTTTDGLTALMYSIKDSDYSKMVFSDGVKAFCMFNDVVISESGFAEGYIVIFDMKGLALGHLARVSLPALRSFMIYIQEAHPVRLKGIHVINTANFINHVMRLVTPLIRSELIGILKFHPGTQIPGVPQEMMPAEYGGNAPSTSELDDQMKNMILDKYSKWLLHSSDLKADETKRIKKASWWNIFSGSSTESKDVKEKEAKMKFANMEID